MLLFNRNRVWVLAFFALTFNASIARGDGGEDTQSQSTPEQSPVVVESPTPAESPDVTASSTPEQSPVVVESPTPATTVSPTATLQSGQPIPLPKASPRIVTQPAPQPVPQKPQLPLLSGRATGGIALSSSGTVSPYLKFDALSYAHHRGEYNLWLNLRPEAHVEVDGERVRASAGGVSLHESRAVWATDDHIVMNFLPVDFNYLNTGTTGVKRMGLRIGTVLPAGNSGSGGSLMSGVRLHTRTDDSGLRVDADVRTADLIIGQNDILDSSSAVGLSIVSGDAAIGIKAGKIGYVTATAGGEIYINFADGVYYETNAGLGVERVGGSNIGVKYNWRREKSDTDTAASQTSNQHVVSAGVAF